MKLPRELRIIEYNNGRIIAPPFPFRYENPKNEELKRLRKKYHLDEVVAGAKTEFDKLLRLRSWVRSQWDHGWSFKEQDPILPATNALRILEEVEKGIEFHCGYYATVFIQACLSLGYQARRLGIQKDISHIPITELHKETNIGHCVPEVWSNDYRKWVIMDPDLNGHYEKDGAPLNAYEIRSAWLSGKWKEVNYVQTEPPQAPATNPRKYTAEQRKMWRTFTRYRTMDYYHKVSIEMRNDFLSSDQGCDRLVWADSSAPPQLVAHPNAPVRGVRYAAIPDQLYWTINEVFIDICCAEKMGPLVEVKLQTQTPNFQKFLVNFDNKKWTKKPDTFKWRLKRGDNTIRAKSVNVFGIGGPESRLRIRCR